MSVETWSGKNRGDENFPVGSVLIAARLRPHIHAYYGFARHADDIADHPTLAPPDKLARLDRMQAVLSGTADPTGAPSAERLRASLAQTGVDPRHATDLLIAFRDDARGRTYDTWDDLIGYCAHSAMPVGRYVLALHGENETHTFPPSDALCAALQVLNHLQDCGPDLTALRRCYLPGQMLAARGATLADLRRPALSPALRATLDDVLARTTALTAAAGDLPKRVRDRRLRLECAVIAGVARRLAARLGRRDPLATRVRLTSLDAARTVMGAARFLV